MKHKASFHLHTKEDFIDWKIIDYDIYELINEAQKHDFKILALTCHEKFVCKDEYIDYAKGKWILLIPWIELTLNKTHFRWEHILVLNCWKSSEKVKTFDDLVLFKKNNPDCLIIAPHPGFDYLSSISRKNLVKYLHLFDAIEYSWCYSDKWNINRKNIEIWKANDKPVIATSDLHFMDFFNSDYAIIESENLEIDNIFKSIKASNFRNVTEPKSILKIIRMVWKMYWRAFFN